MASNKKFQPHKVIEYFKISRGQNPQMANNKFCRPHKVIYYYFKVSRGRNQQMTSDKCCRPPRPLTESEIVHDPLIINEVVNQGFSFPRFMFSCNPKMQKSPYSPPLLPPSPPHLLKSEGFLKVEATYKLKSRWPTILICMNSNKFLFQGSLG
jgi:hypothetical protein